MPKIESDGPARLILVRSAGCREKERGIHDRVLRRLREDLEAMEGTLARGRWKDPKVRRRLGKLRERHGSLSAKSSTWSNEWRHCRTTWGAARNSCR